MVVVDPSGVFGPRDYRLTPATRAIIGLLQGDPAMRGVSVTDVRDLAEGQLDAAERGRTGQRSRLTGEVLPPHDLARTFRDLAGIKPATFRPPRWLLPFLAGRARPGLAARSSAGVSLAP